VPIHTDPPGVRDVRDRPCPFASRLFWLHTAIFVLPLIAMLAVASSRAVFNTLGRWQLHHQGALKLSLGAGPIGLGLLLLITL
jgi:hypothetical protein